MQVWGIQHFHFLRKQNDTNIKFSWLIPSATLVAGYLTPVTFRSFIDTPWKLKRALHIEKQGMKRKMHVTNTRIAIHTALRGLHTSYDFPTHTPPQENMEIHLWATKCKDQGQFTNGS